MEASAMAIRDGATESGQILGSDTETMFTTKITEMEHMQSTRFETGFRRRGFRVGPEGEAERSLPKVEIIFNSYDIDTYGDFFVAFLPFYQHGTTYCM